MASLYHIPKEIISWKNATKTAAWKLVPGSFVFGSNEATLLMENEIFEAMFLYGVCNEHAGILRFLFIDSLKIKKAWD